MTPMTMVNAKSDSSAASTPATPAKASAALNLSAAQFDRLRKIVYDRSGIWFADSKKYALESRLARRLGELEMDSYDQYCTYLTIGPYQADEFQEMFNRITINETSFFRNEPQLQVFETTVLPALLEKRRTRKQLRIWSAGCSTGEEPYTLGIQLHRSLGLRLSDWRIEILGTDISEKALLVAQSARYPDYAFRTTSPLVMQRYFRVDGACKVVDEEIRKLVSFTKLNLKDISAARRLGQWDVIFCRNVMIYFDDPMKDHCVGIFHDQLEPDGTLFIGHSETLRNEAKFLPRREAHAFAYWPVGKGGSHVQRVA